MYILIILDNMILKAFKMIKSQALIIICINTKFNEFFFNFKLHKVNYAKGHKSKVK